MKRSRRLFSTVITFVNMNQCGSVGHNVRRVVISLCWLVVRLPCTRTYISRFPQRNSTHPREIGRAASE